MTEPDENAPSRGRGLGVLALRAALVLLPLAYLAPRVDGRAVMRALGAVGPAGLGVALALQACSVVVGAVRWRGLLRAYGAPDSSLPGVLTLVRHAFVGIYFAMLPTGLVGDVVRARRTEHALGDGSTALVVALVDRLAGAFGLLALGALTLLLPLDPLAHPVVRLASSALAVVSLGLAVGLLVAPRWVAARPAWHAPLARLPASVRALLVPSVVPGTAALARALGLSLLTQAFAIVGIFVLVSRAAPAGASWLALAALPWVVLATYVPVTPGGVGQRELVFVALLVPAGLTADEATAASIATMAMTWLTAAVGLVLAGAEGPGPGAGRAAEPPGGPATESQPGG